MINYMKRVALVSLSVCLFAGITTTRAVPSAFAGPTTQLDISIDDGGTRGSDGAFVPYDVTVSAQGGSAEDAMLTIVIPQGAEFYVPPGATSGEADASIVSPGWACDGDGGPGDVCRLLIAFIAAGNPQIIRFALVAILTLDLYVDVAVAAAGIPTVRADIVTPFLAAAFCQNDFVTCAAACVLCYFLQNDPGCFWLISPFQTAGNTMRLGELPGIVGSSAGFTLFRLRDRVLSATRGGQRAVELYYEHSAAVVNATFSNPNVMPHGLAAISAWSDAFDALVDGEGDTVTVTQGQIDATNTFLDTLRAASFGDLAAAIDRERANLDVNGMVGRTMDDVMAEVELLSCEGFEDTLFCGEITGDCAITATDALSVLQIAVGLAAVVPEADTDGSGSVTATDALKTLRIAVGSEPPTSDCNL